MNLVSGCSYTEGASWPIQLFDRYTNLGRRASGNRYIADSVISTVLTEKIHSVFILWSGLNRMDLALPEHVDTQEVYTTSLFNSQYVHMPYKPFPAENYQRIKGPNWPELSKFAEWQKLPAMKKNEAIVRGMFNTGHSAEQLALETHDRSANAHWCTQTLLSMTGVQHVLDAMNVGYRFSFIADVHHKQNQQQFGWLDTEHKLYTSIDWSRYIDTTPFEYGVKHNGLMLDNFHVESDCMNAWAKEVAVQWQ